MRQEYRVQGLPEPLSHYTDAVRHDNTLYISGVVGMDESNKLAEGGVVGQARQIFRNMQKIFDAVGGNIGFKDVLKVTVYMLNVNERSAINPVRKEFFGEHRPASTLVGINALALPGLQIEIEAVAAIPG
ncbi:MAG TPA: RidA family protein [Steroidobacteraceae bacterium]|jgi:2-iminobutanoate/2-iminopropanoate deaminase|nr:RidA family protein [Steroidobacteraceae bacterium]